MIARSLRLLGCAGWVLLLASPTAAAAVYKCNENGKTVFRDEPCAEGQGKKFNLGATIESDDPTGTRGDVSGSFSIGSRSATVGDALGVMDKGRNELVLYMIPGRYTSAEVEHFQNTGNAEVLGARPPLDPAVSTRYPYLEIVMAFKQGQPRTRQHLESMVLLFHGLNDAPEPVRIEPPVEEWSAAIRQFSVFENVVHGDIDLEAEQELTLENQPVAWTLSIRAPIYIR